jgi:Integrase core domain.
LGGKLYAFVIVDDFSRYTWVFFLTHKNETFHVFTKFCKQVQNEKGYTITCIRSDRGREFDNSLVEDFCDENGFMHNFSAPRTPQSNGVVERKNRSLQEMARTMLNEHPLPEYFWGEAVNTSCYVINRTSIRKGLGKTPYELWRNIKPNVGYFKVFGCKCYILNDREHLKKFDAKSDEGVFLGYALNSKAYRVFNKKTLVVQESLHVTFDETNPFVPTSIVEDDDEIKVVKKQLENLSIDKDHSKEILQIEEKEDNELPKVWKKVHNHPIDQVLGDPTKGVLTRSSLRDVCNNLAFVSQIEPKNIKEAEIDEFWMMAMQEELNQFERNEV